MARDSHEGHPTLHPVPIPVGPAGAPSLASCHRAGSDLGAPDQPGGLSHATPPGSKQEYPSLSVSARVRVSRHSSIQAPQSTSTNGSPSGAVAVAIRAWCVCPIAATRIATARPRPVRSRIAGSPWHTLAAPTAGTARRRAYPPSGRCRNRERRRPIPTPSHNRRLAAGSVIAAVPCGITPGPSEEIEGDVAVKSEKLELVRGSGNVFRHLAQENAGAERLQGHPGRRNHQGVRPGTPDHSRGARSKRNCGGRLLAHPPRGSWAVQLPASETGMVFGHQAVTT